MAKDLRSFLKEIENSNPDELYRVSKEVDPKYELAGIVTKLEQERRSPIIIFDKIRGTKFPAVVNVNASRRRIAAGMGATLETVRETYLKAVEKPIPPRTVPTGPVQQLVLTGDDVNLLSLPQTIFHSQEEAPYITAGVVMAKDPETGIRNASYNRLMIRGKNRMTIYMTAGKHLWEYHSRAEAKNEALPVSVHIGSHPAWAAGILFTASFDIDEMGIAGALLGEPVEMVRCKTVPMDVPAHA